ncbi:vesicle-trafficking protein SEC22c isoform X6 [Rattus norvegicus]|uniref:vesicle-trafficking protein SEC22c isoform X6 n=1 Tax=Rattus norvegicus TaxID=10116 RepID=UPI0019179A80|nr:vesicle-trafficking protein SEC22c isoform X6 [Rattus norvegicus]
MATPQRTLNLTRGAILEVPTLLVCLRHFTVVSLTLLSRGLTAPNLRMKPVTALGVLSLVLNIMCAALNLIRGVHLAEHSLQVAQEEVGNILAFFIPSVACIVQSNPDSEGAVDAGLHLPGQCVPARAEEHLANPLPRRGGFSVFISDPDQTAAGEAVRLRSVRRTSCTGWHL